jgi:hypothetical protein
MSVIIMKLSLVKLCIDFTHDYSTAEPLILDVLEVASIAHLVPFPELEECKETLAKHFCRICVRRAVQAGKENEEDRQLQHVKQLFTSGIGPAELPKKVVQGEDSRVYLAMLQRLTASIEDALETLRPWMDECSRMIHARSADKTGGMWALGISLIALGHIEDGLSFIRQAAAKAGWTCDGCDDDADHKRPALVCEYCFEWFCKDCTLRISEPDLTRFCVPGHRLVDLELPKAAKPGQGIFFRGAVVSMEYCLKILKYELGMNDYDEVRDEH